MQVHISAVLCFQIGTKRERVSSSQFTFHIEWQILQIRSSRERCEVPRSIRVCRGFEKILHRSVVMELDTEVKLLPPAIQAFMTELGGAIPEVFSSSPYIPSLSTSPNF